MLVHIVQAWRPVVRLSGAAAHLLRLIVHADASCMTELSADKGYGARLAKLLQMHKAALEKTRGGGRSTAFAVRGKASNTKEADHTALRRMVADLMYLVKRLAGATAGGRS
jgi:hypothetical protein